jgi:hypothetical protein
LKGLKELKGSKEFFRFAQDDKVVVLSSRAKRGISFDPFNSFNPFNLFNASSLFNHFNLFNA